MAASGWRSASGVGKRPSVTGSDFDGGRRVFAARAGGGEGVNLAEGPLDALALAALRRMGILRRALGVGPIVGAAGAGGWRSAAVAALAGAGDAVRCRRTGRDGGRRRISARSWSGPAGSGALSSRRPAWIAADVTDVEAAERAAIRDA